MFIEKVKSLIKKSLSYLELFQKDTPNCTSRIALKDEHRKKITHTKLTSQLFEQVLFEKRIIFFF